jgi:hypothetical protein
MDRGVQLRGNMRSAESLEGCIELVINEVVRLANIEAVTSELRDGGVQAAVEIRDWRGQKRILGRAAAQTLLELSDEALASSEFDSRIDRGRAYLEVLEMIGPRYLDPNRREIDGEEIARDLREAIAAASADCRPRTHFVPCSLVLPRGTQLALGPVLFRPTEDVLDSLASAIAAHFKMPGDEIAGGFSERDSVLEYYRAFPDIASVTVPSCDNPTSRVVATEAIQDVEGTLTTSVSRHFTAGVRVDDEWWKDLAEGTSFSLIQAIGTAIEAKINRRVPELLAARFVDAVTWYGEAARESAPASAIVKYLIAMEALLWTGEDRGVTKRTASRAAALCFSVETWNFSEIEADVRLAYGVRSDLVHGRVSPTDPQVARSLRICEQVSRQLLDVWLERFHQGFDRTLELAHLKAHLDQFVRNARQAADAARGT